MSVKAAPHFSATLPMPSVDERLADVDTTATQPRCDLRQVVGGRHLQELRITGDASPAAPPRRARRISLVPPARRRRGVAGNACGICTA